MEYVGHRRTTRDWRMLQQFRQISFGKTRFHMETGGFVITETNHPPGFLLARHSHLQANLVCVLDGTFTERVGSDMYHCSPRSLLLKPGGAAHSNKYEGSGARCLIIEVQPQRLNASDLLSNTFSEVKHLNAGTAFTAVARIRSELGMRDSASSLAIEGLVLELLASFTRLGYGSQPECEPRRAREARDFIYAHFSESISLSDVAESVGLHPAHLARVFRRLYQCSVGDYIRRLRIDKAAREMAASEESLAAIAASVGFYDQSHFTSIFKLHTGMTPAEYRSAARARKTLPRVPQSSKK